MRKPKAIKTTIKGLASAMTDMELSDCYNHYLIMMDERSKRECFIEFMVDLYDEKLGDLTYGK